MTDSERKLFWDTLSELHDDSQESWDKLRAVYKPPEKLCRFRTVNQNTLQQLQDNILYFSSANHYDDPFDTYFYINYAQVRNETCRLESILKSGDTGTIYNILKYYYGVEVNRELISLMLEQEKQFPLVPDQLEKKVSQVKQKVHQQLFSICFCDDPKNETLWLKYADNHRGFVLNFEMSDSEVFQCSKDNTYDENCFYLQQRPNVYPIYYSNRKYDATKYAIGVQALSMIPPIIQQAFSEIVQKQESELKWEIERISLIKKKCHENDHEWRMLCPVVGSVRPAIKMKPTSIALGLRMPEYERRLVISAAKVAGIASINEMVINDMDELQMRPVTD